MPTSDLDRLRQLEKNVGKQLTEVSEQDFQLDNVMQNSYALSPDRKVIGFYLKGVHNNTLQKLLPFQFEQLKYLYLIGIKLSDITILSELKNLIWLDLSSNEINDISALSELENLIWLSLNSNEISDISAPGKLENLRALELDSNKLNNISALSELENLRVLKLDSNKLNDISALGKLENLTELSLNSNEISDISALSELENLIWLELDFNEINDVSALSRLESLRTLKLASNKINDILALSDLESLRTLELASNKISDVSTLGKLENLTNLDLSDNRIKEIPRWLAEKGVEIKIDKGYASNCINLSRNPIEQPPLELVKEGNEAIRNYYDQLEAQGEDFLYEAKMLIVGEGGSGKTTLACKIQNTDCPLPHIDDRTKGITINAHTFATKTKSSVKDQPFQLYVWDFGGQEIYHATHRFFLSKRSLYVLVADNRKNDTDFNYWLNIIELFADDSPLIIVLNEKDDVRRNINTSELHSRYPESIKEIVSINFKTQEEIDKNKCQQRLKKIEKLISHIEHYAASLPHIGEAVPARWVNVRQTLEDDIRNYIYQEQFDEICYRHQITDAQDITTLLGYFHDLGIVLHFADNSLLRNRIILKPGWATNAVYRIFDHDTIITKEGRFTRNDCINLWRDEQYHYMHDALIELMKNFRLVYEIGNTGQLVAPQMLPQKTPDYIWEFTKNSRMQFRYNAFMPNGILWQFVVMMYRYIENHQWVWCNGVILQREGTRAEVIENLLERRIDIRFSGNNITEFRAIVADTLDEISNSYHQLKYDKMIPCNCNQCQNADTPNFYEFSDLKRRKEKGKSTIECKVSYEDVPVLPLLEGLDDESLRMQRIIYSTAPRETKTIKIFLASSSELENDRQAFEIFINRKNKTYIKSGVFLELIVWEDFLDAMSPTRMQDEYNKAVACCDVFVSLFYTKVGPYTEEEFLTAWNTFKDKSRPLVYTYFKDAAIKMSDIIPEIQTLFDFKQKLHDLGHYPTIYANIHDLQYKFSEQLIRLIPKLTDVSQSVVERIDSME